ncbi:MAG: Lacal_2735 family protein [Ekhidna sp.]|nr:Lacal_2735 family protein [Ekhidna sp.]
MFKFFRKNKVEALEKKYNKLMQEAYILCKANPEESWKKQQEAIEVRKQIIEKQAA